MARAVFLDRDGVINRAVVRDGLPYPPRNVTELEVFPEAGIELQRLHDAGFYLVVVTNQPDVARGTQTQAAVEAIHHALKEKLPVDDVRVCYHDDSDNCLCRKPKPGMILDSAKIYNLDLKQSFMVGDRWRDIEAGQQAGCKTIFIDYQYAETNCSHPDVRVSSLTEAVRWILQQA